jgi:hypothetical protein
MSRFSASSSVDVVAFRFYKAAYEQGIRHTGTIYDALTGAVLATTGAFTDMVHPHTHICTHTQTGTSPNSYQ